MKTKYSAVVIGLDNNGLCVVRGLGKKAVPTYILCNAAERNDVYGKTKYGLKKIINTKDGNSIIRALHSLPSSEKYVLFPTTDYIVEYLSQQRESIPDNCYYNLPSQEVVNLLLDKTKFGEFALSHGFLYTETHSIASEEDIRFNCKSMVFPVIAKTHKKIYKNGLEKAYVLYSYKELIDWYHGIKAIHEHFLIQRFIEGRDSEVYFTLLYISKDGSIDSIFTGRKLRQWPPLRGGTSAAEPVYLPCLESISKDFFHKINCTGICSMEYKYDKTSESYYMIEPTVGRTDFQEGVALCNGINIPWHAFADISNREVRKETRKLNTKYIWIHWTLDSVAREKLIAEKKMKRTDILKEIWRIRGFDFLSLQDPTPAIYYIYSKIKHKFKYIILEKLWKKSNRN